MPNISTSFSSTLTYQESGNPDKSPIVFIHGFPADHRMWAAQVAALQADYRVITYDVRGLGQSQIQDDQFTLEMLVDDLFALFDHLALGEVTLVGFSMGGYIALRAYEREPKRIGALVLADTQSGADSNAAKLKRTTALKAIKTDGMRAFGESFVLGALSDKTLQGKPAIVSDILEMIAANSVSGAAGCLLAMAGRTDTSAILPHIQAQTLLLVGEHDAITPPAVARAMQEQIPGARLEVVADAGHFAPMENAPTFNASLLKFLGKVHSR